MYDKVCATTFLKEQGKLFDEPVANTVDEARVFLEECMAEVFDSIEEVREYLDESMDISDLSDEELVEEAEIFKLPDGRYLIVEA